ncbi:uncharacterized protein YALI1_F02008g [Yarrowia lipolytica]|uniref:Uncharacterized protein n=1 Tax=Yarrowia lipolytica TaxID=4952 RepID=A0A1D8NLH2_YARLL|nr:hypothetical protein YALI1_F02008g [Yarrowia lipolytica]
MAETELLVTCSVHTILYSYDSGTCFSRNLLVTTVTHSSTQSVQNSRLFLYVLARVCFGFLVPMPFFMCPCPHSCISVPQTWAPCVHTVSTRTPNDHAKPGKL